MWQNDVTKVTSPEPGGLGQANQNLEGRSSTVTEFTTVSIGLKNRYCWLNYWHTRAKYGYERFYVLYFIDNKTKSVNGLNSLQI